MLLCAGCANVDLNDIGEPDLAQDMSARPDMTTTEDMPEMLDMSDMDLSDIPADMEVEPDLSPSDMPVDADMMIAPDMEDMPDMRPDMAPDMMVQPCGGMCGATEECQQGRCVDLCAGVMCGAVAKTGGGEVMCGTCGGVGQICSQNQCVAACQDARVECGELLWSAQTAQCGACGAGTGCFRNECMTGTANGWRDVAAGEDFTCATRASGAVLCWGDNGAGQLGDVMAGTRRLVPNVVTGLAGVVELSIASRHVCALDTNRRVWCWGLNDNGQIGNSSTMNQPTPVQVGLGGASAVALATSLWHTCAATTDGKTRCWGFNGQGQLGDNTTFSSYQPIESRILTTTYQLDAGLAHTCAMQRDNTAWCWGFNGTSPKAGRLGQGAAAEPLAGRVVPSQVAGLVGQPVRQVASGNGHSCALLQSGQIRCWGDNTFGQLGNNSAAASSSPVLVANITDAIHIAAGLEHTCAILGDHTVRCWGRNDEGQLGTGNKNVARTPVALPSLGDVVSLGLGYYHSCAVLRDGKMYCWGANAKGQLGDNTTAERLTPTLVL
jgi:alpha-tubulin suppressor-like RCC1 family protein